MGFGNVRCEQLRKGGSSTCARPWRTPRRLLLRARSFAENLVRWGASELDDASQPVVEALRFLGNCAFVDAT